MPRPEIAASRIALPGGGDGGEKPGVALAQYLVHPGRSHVGLLQDPERLARIDGAKLPGVSREDDAGDAERFRDAQERLHLHCPDHRGLIDREHRARVVPARPVEAGRIGEVPVTQQKPL